MEFHTKTKLDRNETPSQDDACIRPTDEVQAPYEGIVQRSFRHHMLPLRQVGLLLVDRLIG